MAKINANNIISVNLLYMINSFTPLALNLITFNRIHVLTRCPTRMGVVQGCIGINGMPTMTILCTTNIWLVNLYGAWDTLVIYSFAVRTVRNVRFGIAVFGLVPVLIAGFEGIIIAKRAGGDTNPIKSIRRGNIGINDRRIGRRRHQAALDGSGCGGTVVTCTTLTTKMSAKVKMTTRIEGKSQQEREEQHSNADGSVSFLLLPTVVVVVAVAGHGRMIVVDTQLFHDDAGDDTLDADTSDDTRDAETNEFVKVDCFLSCVFVVFPSNPASTQQLPFQLFVVPYN